MTNHAEDRFHVSVARYLDLALGDGTAWVSIENRQNGPREGARRKARGCKAGHPDVEIYHAGSVFMIELKTKKGVVSQNQKERHHELRTAGIPVRICRSLEDVEDFLRNYGIPLKGEVKGRYAPKTNSFPNLNSVSDVEDDEVARAKRALLSLSNKKSTEAEASMDGIDRQSSNRDNPKENVDEK